MSWKNVSEEFSDEMETYAADMFQDAAANIKMPAHDKATFNQHYTDYTMNLHVTQLPMAVTLNDLIHGESHMQLMSNMGEKVVASTLNSRLFYTHTKQGSSVPLARLLSPYEERNKKDYDWAYDNASQRVAHAANIPDALQRNIGAAANITNFKPLTEEEILLGYSHWMWEMDVRRWQNKCRELQNQLKTLIMYNNDIMYHKITVPQSTDANSAHTELSDLMVEISLNEAVKLSLMTKSTQYFIDNWCLIQRDSGFPKRKRFIHSEAQAAKKEQYLLEYINRELGKQAYFECLNPDYIKQYCAFLNREAGNKHVQNCLAAIVAMAQKQRFVATHFVDKVESLMRQALNDYETNYITETPSAKKAKHLYTDCDKSWYICQ